MGGFKYIPVPASDYGISLEEILTLPDKDLTKRRSIKLYAPYVVLRCAAVFGT